MTAFLLSFSRKRCLALIHKNHHGFKLGKRFRLFCSNKRIKDSQTNSLANALRVLDLIYPNRIVTPKGRQTHLRLIQDFLCSESDQLGAHKLANDFSISHSKVSNGFDQFFESSSRNVGFLSERLRIDARVLSDVLSSCGSKRDLLGGIQYHCVTLKTGFVIDVYVGSSLVSLYGKCGELLSAYEMFDEMPVRNVVSWTAIIAAFGQEWKVDMCLELLQKMAYTALKPNDYTFTSILSACTGSGAFGQGRSVHCQTIKMGFESYLHIANALISMYCKCGVFKDALFIFEEMESKDIVSWNSMIAGYAQHGLSWEAINLFEEMKKKQFEPDAITFLGVLSSCRHAGFLEEGRHYLNLMVEYGLEPELDHYSCVIDLLGRSGLLEEALDFIEKIPIYPNSVIWGSLLSSCRLHGNVWIGIKAAEKRLLLEPGCAATHVQLANLYARVGWWNHAANLRKLMKDSGLKTSPGYSWIEVHDKIHIFGAEDSSNTKMVEILGLIDSIADHMRTFGREPEVEEDEVDRVIHTTSGLVFTL